MPSFIEGLYISSRVNPFSFYQEYHLCFCSQGLPTTTKVHQFSAIYSHRTKTVKNWIYLIVQVIERNFLVTQDRIHLKLERERGRLKNVCGHKNWIRKLSWYTRKLRNMQHLAHRRDCRPGNCESTMCFTVPDVSQPTPSSFWELD
jgi:hypothetical protein